MENKREPNLIIQPEWYIEFEDSDDATAGWIIKTIIGYKKTGKVPTDIPAELKRLVRQMCAGIDRYSESYASKCRKNQEIAIERERKKRERTFTNVHERERTYTNSTNPNPNESNPNPNESNPNPNEEVLEEKEKREDSDIPPYPQGEKRTQGRSVGLVSFGDFFAEQFCMNHNITREVFDNLVVEYNDYILAHQEKKIASHQAYFGKWAVGTLNGRIPLGAGEFINDSGQRTYGDGRVIVPGNAPSRPSKKHAWHNGKWCVF